VRSYTAAEKGDEGMALKIRIRAEDMPDKERIHFESMPLPNGRDKAMLKGGSVHRDVILAVCDFDDDQIV
jgi:hypothetical protein